MNHYESTKWTVTAWGWVWMVLGQAVCMGMEVRLVDGGSRCAGRVEVKQQGQWGTMCGDSWDMNDVAVVCKQLGCGSVVGPPQYRHFGPGSGPICMGTLGCNGSKSALSDCTHRGWGENDCDHYEDAGVMCSGKGTSYSPCLDLGLWKEPGCALRDQPSGTRALPNVAGHTAELALSLLVSPVPGERPAGTCPRVPLPCLAPEVPQM
uniref:SRCR domain-containing protein n=1 Tax=Strix occidentalis caurina TaxID=311401 RepID=A0A8D0FSW3_STROC